MRKLFNRIWGAVLFLFSIFILIFIGLYFRGSEADELGSQGNAASSIETSTLDSSTAALAESTGIPEENSPLLETSLDDYYAESIYVYNVTDDHEVLNLNGDEPRPMASLTKIMTTYLGVLAPIENENLAPIIPETYYAAVEDNLSMAGFYPGEETHYIDLLYGVLLPSGGEASLSLAIHTSGDLELFVDQMNQKALEIGLSSTHYTNVTGNDHPDHYSTAQDVALLLKTAIQHPDFREILTSATYRATPTSQHPDGLPMESTIHAGLANHSYEGFEVLGGKSGVTPGAGLSWATLNKKNGKEYIVVVMGVAFESLDNKNDNMILDTLKIMTLL